jgi:hypothetical protein
MAALGSPLTAHRASGRVNVGRVDVGRVDVTGALLCQPCSAAGWSLA